MQHLLTGVGGAATDASFSALGSRPVWHLKPLPLSQINPSITSRPSRGPVKSLHSLSLGIISRNFHLYSPEDLKEIPLPILQRLLSRIRAERLYEDTPSRAGVRPDEATIWAYSTCLDPEEDSDGTARHHTLALSVPVLLLHLVPGVYSNNDEHPLLAIPKLYATLNPQSSMTMLTTITLSDDVSVTDTSIQSIKYATHLTCLWINRCKITDPGIRLLASCLTLSEDEGARMGPWRLRVLGVNGCKGVTDRSMQVFARWPGLSLIDVRDTSVTTAGAGIFNRQQRLLFSCRNTDLQPCPTTLRPLFATSDPASIVNKLSFTLLKPSSGPHLPHRALHIIPSHRPIPPEHLPTPPSTSTSTSTSTYTSRNSATAYKGEYGQLYGTGVALVRDEVKEHRKKVANAIRVQHMVAEDEARAAMGLQPKNFKPENWTWKRWDAYWDDRDPVTNKKQSAASAEKERKMIEKERKKKLKGFKDDSDVVTGRSKAFVKGTGKKAGMDIDVEADGEPELMLVRMVSDGWERFTWTTTTTTESTNSHADLQISATQRIRKGTTSGLIGDILGASSTQITLSAGRVSPITLPSSSPPSSSPPHTPSTSTSFPGSSSTSHKPQFHRDPSSSQSSTPPTSNTLKNPPNPFKHPSSSQTPTSHITLNHNLNPFKQAANKRAMGIRPLALSQSPSQAIPLEPYVHQVNVTPVTQSPVLPKPVQLEEKLQAIPSQSGLGAFGFTTSQVKRRFQGSSLDADISRKSMRMFGQGRT
ncbi:hypothetical protein BCR39DRAFT_586635 [Naematelia encephala]|uniref:Uncharacterized protein n=1 Tax=Naematelia encephala TaxID=71784 RepID=A0A1Y2BEW6_9TREE|nr:hypothetical protein BCR39DRAFT_586635 [Naematelia encephala]